MSNHEQVGTTSRQKQKFTHVAGLKSFACVADDEELSFGQKVGRLQLFDITYRKKDGSLMTTEAAEIMVLKGMVRFDSNDLSLTQPNILDPAHSNTCL
ncbi:hypothetical protein PVK06_034026 [Gossypium arboreum]|uniref:Uncharacterized protein n=1 Tax=Gossypium arboreum TaxID=29729 RepID=A0ABR0ND10_GOSAR|nr:hypothetical protein PVK06_034026 [Gossypium arboreum]